MCHTTTTSTATAARMHTHTPAHIREHKTTTPTHFSFCTSELADFGKCRTLSRATVSLVVVVVPLCFVTVVVDPLPGMPKLPRAAVVDVYPEAADAMGRACGGATAGPVGMPNKLKESLRGRFCAMVSRHNAPHAHTQHPPAFHCQFRIIQGRIHPVARPQAWCV